MIVQKLQLIPTGRFHDQVHRPFNIHTDGHLEHQLKEVTHGGSKLEHSNLAGVAGQILRPAAQPTGAVQIANGWAEPRVRFLLEIRHPTMDGPDNIQYLTGYTDYVGFNPGTQSIDPNMQFYINNTITTRSTQMMTHHGYVDSLRLAKASHVVTGAPPGSLQNFQNAVHTMRPEDVVGTMSTMHDEFADLTLNLGSSFGGIGPGQSHMKLSDRNHGLPARYMSKMFKGYRAGMDNASGGADIQELTNGIVGLVRDETPAGDRFISNMLRHGLSLTENTWFSFKDLCDLCPETPQRTQIILSQGVQHQPDFRQYTQEFYAPTHEVLVSTILSHALPAIMTELMLAEVAFTVTNRNMEGQPTFVPAGARSFANVDLGPFMRSFESRFMFEVWRELTRDNQIDMELIVDFSLVGNSTIKVGWMGRQPETFVIPSFSDGLMAPIVTNSYQNVTSMATEFDKLTSLLSADLSPNAYAPQPKLVDTSGAPLGQVGSQGIII